MTIRSSLMNRRATSLKIKVEELVEVNLEIKDRGSQPIFKSANLPVEL